MKAKTTNNKASAKKKLIPAAGSLAISAVMLASSTYAWFTMSREVEVTGIKMTATVPEDLQISLGTLGTNATTIAKESDNKSLVSNNGVLVEGTSGSTASDGKVLAPTNSWDWSNSADISAYYDFGRLIPASSYNGHDIFFTPDANGVGKTVKASADYIKVTSDADNLVPVNDANTATNVTNNNYKTTLHALTAERSAQTTDTWATATTGGYTQADAYNITNDDGYYVDIPIWIRSSSNAAVSLSVDGYIIPGTTTFANDTDKKKQTDLELYRAVRVALLDGETVDASAEGAVGAVACTKGDTAVTAEANGLQKNIIPLKDAWVSSTGTTLVSTTAANMDTADYTSANILTSNTPFANTNPSIVDTLNYKRATVGNANMNDTDLYGVSAVATDTSTIENGDGTAFHAPTYTQFNTLTPTYVASGTPDTVATIEGSGTGKDYGTAKKLIVRVWLDGEDGECWNDNAGQDWAISLKFSKIETPAQQNP